MHRAAHSKECNFEIKFALLSEIVKPTHRTREIIREALCFTINSVLKRAFQENKSKVHGTTTVLQLFEIVFRIK